MFSFLTDIFNSRRHIFYLFVLQNIDNVLVYNNKKYNLVVFYWTISYKKYMFEDHFLFYFIFLNLLQLPSFHFLFLFESNYIFDRFSMSIFFHQEILFKFYLIIKIIHICYFLFSFSFYLQYGNFQFIFFVFLLTIFHNCFFRINIHFL